MKNNFLRILLLALAFGVGAKLLVERMKQDKAVYFVRQKIRDLAPAKNFKRKKVTKATHYSWSRFFRENHTALILLLIVGVSFVGSSFLTDFSHLFRASLIGLPETNFTGTISPIEKVPNWVELSEIERTLPYDKIPQSKMIPLPDYDLSEMQKGMLYDEHNKNEKERNTYLTYPVPNMGDYRLNAKEGSGSHTGVDIKAPIGTPVRAIANGTVYKTGNQATGFGKHIVIAHVGIPDPEKSGRKTSLFSDYAHLSEISVREGEDVTKGQVIGKVGETGMATAPHLHFQIDKSDAPFFPYWPISWSDVEKAGLNSFFEAVKRGIGKELGVRYTINPMNFVADYTSYVGTENLVASTVMEFPAVTTPTSPRKITPPPASIPVVETSEEFVMETPAEETPVKTAVRSKSLSEDDIEFVTDRIYVPGEEKLIQLKVKNSDIVVRNVVEISSTLRNLAEVSPSTLNPEDFENGVAEVRVKTDTNRTFKLVASGDFGEIKSDSLRAQVFKDVAPGDSAGEAIQFLKDESIASGYPDGTFRPDETLNRAEAVKILLTANKISVESEDAEFPDVAPRDWFTDYVGTAVARGIVKGYSDGMFKPGNTISRAEFLKVAIESAGIKTPTKISGDAYADVREDAWFAPYFEVAKQHGLLPAKRGGYIVPTQPITRAEAAVMIYKLAGLK